MQEYNIPYIPYDKNLVSRARELRKETTEAERIFWDKVLKNKNLIDFKFTRQKPLDRFIVDFCCASLGIVTEIDGETHNFQKIRDRERDNMLEQKYRLKIIRYTNEDVLHNTEKIVDELCAIIQNATHL